MPAAPINSSNTLAGSGTGVITNAKSND